MRKLLFIAIQSANQSNGGMESATRAFEALSSEFEWILVTNRETRFTERWRKSGAVVHVVNVDLDGRQMKRATGFVRLGLAIRRIIGQERPDILHVNDIRAGMAAAPFCGSRRYPLFFTVRDSKPNDMPYGLKWRLITSRCRKIVALSDEMSHTLQVRLGLRPDQMQTIYSIINLDEMRPCRGAERTQLRNSLGIGQEEFAVGCIGAFMPKKAQLDFLEKGLPSLVRRLPQTKVHFLGDYDPHSNPYAERCQNVIRSLCLDDAVACHGHSTQIAQWYKALDLVLVTSVREGLARCMIEAMACGTPVVSFDVCSAREMLETTGAGIVVAQGDYSGLAEAVVELSNDASRRRSMGKVAREHAEQLFVSERVVSAYRALYGQSFRSF